MSSILMDGSSFRSVRGVTAGKPLKSRSDILRAACLHAGVLLSIYQTFRHAGVATQSLYVTAMAQSRGAAINSEVVNSLSDQRACFIRYEV